MATVALWLDNRNKDTNKFPVVLRVSHQQKTRYIPMGFRASIEEWNDGDCKLQKPFPNCGRANAVINYKYSIANKFITEGDKSTLKKYTVDEIKLKIESLLEENQDEGIEKIESKTSVFKFGTAIVERMKKAKREGYALSIESCIGAYKAYTNEKELYFSDVKVSWIKEFEAYHQGKGNKINTYGVYLRTLRMFFNEAIKDETTEVNISMYPFGRAGYSIKSGKTTKRAIKEPSIDSIRKLQLEEGSEMWHSRNYFLLIFNCRGINFLDLSFLVITNIQNGRLRYIRNKTKKQFDIKLNEEAVKIFNYYLKEKRNKNLVLPILEDVIEIEDTYELRKKYLLRMKTHNKNLKKIAKLAEIDVNLTTYVARHSFATLAKRKGLSTPMIGDLLGHADPKTTETYLSEFESEEMDKAADLIYN